MDDVLKSIFWFNVLFNWGDNCEENREMVKMLIEVRGVKWEEREG